MHLVIEEYDPATCVTAKELRANNVQIPLEIPDPAWVPKRAVRYDIRGAETTYDVKAMRIDSIIPVHVDVPFRWFEVVVEEGVEKTIVRMSENEAKVG